MNEEISNCIARAIRGLTKCLYPKTEIIGQENIPQEPALFIGNHSQIHGPIVSQICFSENYRTWCAGQMMHLKEVPAYAFQDFWSHKPRYTHWFYKGLSYLIAPLAAFVFTRANTIGVYRDARSLTTFKNTIRHLQEGKHIIIFPEHDAPHNRIVNDFQDKFVDCARLYYKRTGKALHFVPMYISPALHKIFLGTPTLFQPEAPIEQERARLCSYLQDQITAIAVSQPRHRIVPYRNISKKLYPYNTPCEVTPDHENPCC